MAHDHPIIDVDKHFTIDPTTRKVLPDKPDKANLVQFDHNSERLTFELPRYIDGHDMLTCNEVWVHFNNIEVSTKLTNPGVYQVTDLQASEEHEDTLVCSWLVSQEATQLVGLLSFVVSFVCVPANGVVGYRWNSAPYTGISVLNGIFNSDIVLEEYADILVEWEERIRAQDERIRALEEGGGTGGGGGSDIDMEEVNAAIDAALSEAKASGEFDGADGEDGSVWFCGTAVKRDGAFPLNTVPGSKKGDFYLNTSTYDVFEADTGAWGYACNIKGSKGDRGDAGAPGSDGSDGVSITKVEQTTTSSADGGTNVITVTLSDGKTFTFNIKNGSKGSTGATGAAGAAGSAGKDGTSVTVSSVSESTADGGSNVVTFSDGKTLTVKNGSKGSAGTNGSNGIGIKSVVQTTTSNADGGSNVITVTKTDNSTSTFTVKNGKQGSPGAPGYTPVKGTDYWTPTDKQEIVGDVTASLDGIPDYWQAHLDRRVEDIRRAMEAAGRNKSSFFFYSDAHWSNETTYTAKMAPALLKYLHKKTPINKTNYGGDIVSAESTDTDVMAYLWDWREQLRDLPNHHSVIGNHDDGNSTDRLLSKEYIYSYLLAPEESNDIVWGGDFYYYIDDKSESTRYLYLDVFYDGVSSAQVEFVREAIKTAPADWHIVAVCHAWFANDYTNYPPVLNGFATEMADILGMFDNYNAREGEFADCGGWIELCIGGHYHLDHYEHTPGGIPVIIVEADTIHNRSGSMPSKETTDEAAVSAVVVDYNSKVVNVIRVGRGSSYEVPINRVAPVKYTNVIPLSVDKDGNPFNGGKGWADNSRIGSGGIYVGNQTGANAHYVTGHIEIDPTIDNIFRLRNMTFDSSTHNNYAYMVAFFDGNRTKLSAGAQSTDFATNSSLYDTVLDDTNIVEFTIKKALLADEKFSGVKYVAICCSYISDDSIITINEPIE